MLLNFSFIRCRAFSCTVFLCLSSIYLLGQTTKLQVSKDLPDTGKGYEHIERFIRVMEEVRVNHPDADKLSYERLVNFALEGMLGSLDRFSAYYHPESSELVKVDEGSDYDSNETGPPSFPSVGITLNKNTDGYYIQAIYNDSPAEKANIQIKDQLLEIDDQAVEQLTWQQISSFFIKPPGHQTKLKLHRKSDDREHLVLLTHRVVYLDAIGQSILLKDYEKPKTGYIYLRQFSKNSHREIVRALDALEDDGMNQCILDLRGNPGGFLHQAVLILGEFLPPETEVVSTQGRSPDNLGPPLRTQKKKRRERTYPVAVLTDQYSASASELLAGAFQDLKRATVVGETSFGKGSVQNIQSLGNGATLRLTTATYHTPSGKTPHRKGVAPDIKVEISKEDREKSLLQRDSNRLSPEQLKSLNNWKDPVILEALKAL